LDNKHLGLKILKQFFELSDTKKIYFKFKRDKIVLT